MKLNIGSGKTRVDDFLSIDISPKANADYTFDIEDGFPFGDSTIEEIIAYNVLEQISSPKKFIYVMNELHRIMKVRGVLTIRVPNANQVCAWQDPMDCRRFTDESFTYMQYNHPRYKEYGVLYGFKPWIVELIKDAPNVSTALLVFKLQPVK